MKNRIIKVLSLILSLVCLLSGCTFGGTKTKVVVTYPEGKEVQAVVALNPIFFLDGASVAAVSDINTAITTDAKAKTLTSLSENTNWQWISKSSDGLLARATYTLNNWRNRGNISDSKLKAYSYNSDGTISLMSYAASHIKIESYNADSFPEMGILMSTSGDKQENLSYVVDSDCFLEIPAGTLTMVKSVGGVETGFLDSEDGSQRTAVFNIMINNTVLWSGEFGNSVGENGETVTFLEYPSFYDLPLRSGDIVSFGIQLNGKKPDEIYSVEDDGIEDIPVIEDETPDVDENVKEISFVDGYDSRFEIVYPENASIDVQKLANEVFTKVTNVTETSVRLKTDNTKEQPISKYEIIIGETNRAASKDTYSELRGYRKNHANDYIVKVSGNHVVIAAGSEIALKNAANFFLTTYLKDDKSVVPGDMYHVSRPKVHTISIGGVDVSKYVIRTERYPSILTKRAAKNLANYFIVNCGIVVPVENDQKTTKNEILVGLTERSGIKASVFKKESLDYVKGYAPEQYKVFYKKGKLFIEAGSDYAANYATNLVLDQLKASKSVSAKFTQKGVYNTADDKKYTLSDGYGLAWNDEFLSATPDGTPIENELNYWIDDAPAGDDAISYSAYKKDSKLVKEILQLDNSNPLKNLLGEKSKHSSYGDYYPFGKMYQGGFGKTYGVKNNLLYQRTKFDISTGFWNSRLNTKKTMSFRYGIFEVRQMAGAAKGACTALWFTGASGLADDCEIDLYESFGSQNLHPNLHTWANYHTNHTNHGAVRDFISVPAKPEKGKNFYDTFHYIGIEWSKDYIDFYLDGEIFCAVPMNESKWYAFEQKIYPRVDFGVTGGFYLFDMGYIGTEGGIEELLNFDVTQYTDYVRIFQKNGERQRVWDYLAD